LSEYLADAFACALLHFFSLPKFISKPLKIKNKFNFADKSALAMTTATEFALETENLCVSYGEKNILQNLSVRIPAGKMCGIVGPNGAGKSSFLKAILRLTVSQGQVRFFGQAFENVRARVAYLAQKEAADMDFPITVEEVVLMGRNPHKGIFGRFDATDRQKADTALQLTGMSEFGKRGISALSGGQQKRVFLARALAQEADLYLLDEPFAGIDAVSEKSIVKILKNLTAEKKTVVMVHHDLQTVKEYFDFVMLINRSLIAAGDCQKVFTQELTAETYGIKNAFQP
jgi:manganese/zinc/iron transport system ATP- binding protein